MKVGLLLILTVSVLQSIAQSVDRCGMNNDPVITAEEAEFLKNYFKKTHPEFDFEGKKIAFITGSSGSKIGSKTAYFTDIRKWQENGESIATSLVILTPEEKIESGGYDAIITYWVKVFTPKSKKAIIEKLAAQR